MFAALREPTESRTTMPILTPSVRKEPAPRVTVQSEPEAAMVRAAPVIAVKAVA